ncbi:MAG: hypothetical protein HY598_01085, partial [Candidatus Omnitrophica bacterium]|nr:hypothetical protein [Candidatus Omnitrophota bacterium]
MINYQGRLTDTGSKAITGTYILTFRLYDAATSGTKLWQEEQTITLSEADNGVFNVVLGAVTALDSVGFNSAMWLSVQVADDSEMTPRQRLTAAGYALNADQVDGLNSTSFVRTDADSSSSGKLTLTKAGTALVITPSSAPTANTKMVDVQNTSGTSKFSVDYEGDVTVAGDLSVSGTISGSSSATGTTSATWTIDNDNTSGTEPASGAGLVIEGGSGDVSALWDATNDELDVNKTTNITGTLKLSGSTSGYVGLAPAAAAGSTTYTLPSADGSADYVLKTNGSGTLAWAAPGGLSGVGDVTDIGDCDGPTCFTGTEGTTLTFKGSTSGTIALQPAAVAGTTTITMPATTGTLITTGDSGTVTSTMILNDTILNADINSSAAIAFSKLASLTSAYLLVGNASNVATAVDPSGDVDIDNAGTFTIQANSVALSTDTTGNYVASVATSSPLSGGAAGSEGATLTLSCPTCLVSGGGSDLFTLAGTSGTSQTISSGDTLTIAAGTGITTTAGATDTVTVAATLGTSISGSEVDANTLDFADFEDTLDLDAALTLNQTTSTWSQSFTGTTTTGLTYTATDLTSGTALDVNATNTHTADAAIQQVRLDLVNAQATAANSDLAGFNVNFTNSPTIAGNTEAAARIRNVATSNTTDNAVASLLILDNADTSTSGSTAVTDALRVTVSGSLSSGIVDAIDASDANIDNALNIGANVIAGTNFAVNTSGQVATGASAGNQGGSLLFYDTDATSPESITVNAGNVSTSYTLTLPTAVAA